MNSTEKQSSEKESPYKREDGSYRMASATSKKEDKFRLEIPQITLPKGGGAIKGIDEKFEVNPVNGSASLSILLPVTAGRGFAPQLALSYNSGGGNGIFGLGWGIGIPSVSRKTDKKLPQYLDADSNETDTFLLTGAEDLVPYLQKVNEEWLPKMEEHLLSGEKYIVKFYRPRIEGGFARIEKWCSALRKDIYWRVITKENITSIFGKTPGARIADPQDPDKVFEWLLERTYDDKGNVIEYQYKAEDAAGADAGSLHNRNRFDQEQPAYTNKYARRILYGNETSYFPQRSEQSAYQGKFFFETLFDYGEHDESGNEVKPWNYRADAFSSFRPGFEIRTTRLCKRVLLFHHFEKEYNGLVKSLDLTYDINPSAQSTGDTVWEAQRRQFDSLQNGLFTFLKEIRQTHYQKVDAGVYEKRSLPPLSLTYQAHDWNLDPKELPKESVADLPQGIDGQQYQWVDLYNEGISGALTEQAQGWFYKSNLGNGEFAPAALVSPKPSFAGSSSGGWQLQELEGNGIKQLVAYGGVTPGYFELDTDGEWQRFQTFDNLPHVDFGDPNARFLDLDGDGIPDWVVTEESVIRWYPAKGKAGFDESYTSPKGYDEEKGPAVVFSDSTQSIFLADMCGDGLTDIVRIRNGSVCYWPNMGYGKFGSKIEMDDAPVFDHPDLFNPSYLRLVDVDGSGVPDMLYLPPAEGNCWLNLSGNAWAKMPVTIPLPTIDNTASIQTADLLGTGTACIVWSSPLPNFGGSQLLYIDLMNSKKPHLLKCYKNNLGKSIETTYRSSTAFYLEDKKNGTPWITKLPFPVHCLVKTTTKDKWRKTSFSNQYTYHHGYYDHQEREFRGFGRVEQTDTETFGEFAAVNQDSPYISLDHTLYQPPVKTITWFHTGAFLGKGRILDQYSEEYYRPQAGDFQEISLPEPDIEALRTFTMDEWGEALRACKGMTLRQEVYEVSIETDPLKKPEPVKLFTTAFHNCHIRCLQPKRSNKHAVFLVGESESIVFNYQLKLEGGQIISPDPRISHSFNLTFNEYGQVEEAITVTYGRVRLSGRDEDTDTLALIDQVQKKGHAALNSVRYTNHIDEQDFFRLPVPCQVSTFEVTGLKPAVGFYYTIQELRTLLASDIPEIPYHQLSSRAEPQKRLVEQVRTLFFDDLNASVTTQPARALPMGRQGLLGLTYESYKLAFTDDLLDAVLAEKLTDLQHTGESFEDMMSRIMKEGGYGRLSTDENQWWMRSGTAGFEADAMQHFLLPERFTDSFGNISTFRYDKKDLYLESSKDPAGNETAVTQFDFRVIAPIELKDLNDNLTEIAFDLLGTPAAVAVKGKGNEADELQFLSENTLLNLLTQDLTAFFTAPEFDRETALNWLGTATARHIYHTGEEIINGETVYEKSPPSACTILRERHHHDRSGTKGLADVFLTELLQQPADANALQVSMEYSDGSGTVLLKKAQAEPETEGGTLRWIVSGKTIANNKGKVVRQYEPYFSSYGHGVETQREEGVSVVQYYDAAGRNFRTELPNGTFSKVEFDAWQVSAWDANDTVLKSRWYQDRQAAGANRQEKDAATKAARHANTPTITYLDALGRDVVSITDNGVDEAGASQRYRNYVELDAEGKPLWIQDARFNQVMAYVIAPNYRELNATAGYTPAFDMAGNLLFQYSMDAGKRWMLTDAAGQALYQWDENRKPGEAKQEYIYHTRFDALHRPLELTVTIKGHGVYLIERMIYGDSIPDQEARNADSKLSNLRGQLFRHYDASGCMTHVKFDCKGQLQHAERQLLKDRKSEITDWKSAQPDPEVFEQQTAYDALGRMIGQHDWHRAAKPESGAIYLPVYNERGVLKSEKLIANGRATDAIQSILYNEKGQRTEVHYGNRTKTVYAYDPETFRLVHLKTTRPTPVANDILQNLFYTYDPVGNIMQVRDDAHQPVYFKNQEVLPENNYTYDAIYRLIEATGRENAKYNAVPEAKEPDPISSQYPITDKALRDYTQKYAYDIVGNFEHILHIARDGNWTRTYETDAFSNRLLSTTTGQKTTTYRYDTHGSMLNLSNEAGGLETLNWDYRDMVSSVNRQGGGWAHYQYDSQKQRTRKYLAHGNIHEERIYLGGYELYRRWKDASPEVIDEEIETFHLFADDKRILILEGVITTDSNSLGTGLKFRYQYSNHLGSVTAEFDENTLPISYEEYHPYGTVAFHSNNSAVTSTAKRYRYTGIERDEETGLNYHTARYYAPWLGRWVSSDPIGIEGGGNLYGYCFLNPNAFSDKKGKQGILEFAKDTIRDTWTVGSNYSLGVIEGTVEGVRATIGLGVDLATGELGSRLGNEGYNLQQRVQAVGWEQTQRDVVNMVRDIHSNTVEAFVVNLENNDLAAASRRTGGLVGSAVVAPEIVQASVSRARNIIRRGERAMSSRSRDAHQTVGEVQRPANSTSLTQGANQRNLPPRNSAARVEAQQSATSTLPLGPDLGPNPRNLPPRDPVTGERAFDIWPGGLVRQRVRPGYTSDGIRQSHRRRAQATARRIGTIDGGPTTGPVVVGHVEGQAHVLTPQGGVALTAPQTRAGNARWSSRERAYADQIRAHNAANPDGFQIPVRPRGHPRN
ncbi:insecticidal toxin complex protein [Dyadobacter sp. CY261]|uniref:SpvB/TcaC N-terminal domain-containing protein n=1 Tax=Dyadobacter sp. CY261 TaxID=2907203 RepID=UPI001F391B2D|nr:SpvB/TcaC N-terminal domain-containing protein [Dyadobacter sp. CY261]MCF0075526.1 insecticidal toxin complex protein [Dyadobacter sp. CY261]